jgi:general secretion pathway protein A
MGKEKATRSIVSRAAREAFDPPSRLAISLRWGAAVLIPFAALLLLAPSWLQQKRAETVPSYPVPSASALPPAVNLTPAAFGSFSGHPLEESRRMAFATLFELWNLAPAPGDFCVAAEEAGFSCLERQDGLESLRRFNLPAVLPLSGPAGENFYAVLSALEGNRATFRLGEAAVTIPVEELQTRWNGKYVLIWRRPPFNDVLRPGTAGEPVRWLALRLGKALGSPVDTGAVPVLEGEVLTGLKRFQFSRGLAPDGIAGPNTLIFLDAAVGSGVPLLTKPAEEL